MTRIVEDYLREVEAALKTDGATKRQIVSELRAHIQEKMGDVSREMPGATPDEVARTVLRDFGNPRDLAVAYEPRETVIRKSTGEVILRIGRAVGRGTKSFLKWTAIAIAFLLVLATGIGIWAWYEVKPIVEKNAPYSVYSYDEQCELSSCSSTPVEQSFFIHSGAREVRMDVHVTHDYVSVGAVKITVKDPSGTVKYDKTFTSSSGRTASQEVAWGPAVGDWHITYQFTGFDGNVGIRIYTLGLPEDAL